jgi:hypothetical protein
MLVFAFLLALSSWLQGDDLPPRVVLGKFKIEEQGRERRLIYDEILIATQINGMHWADDLIPLGSFSLWDVVMLEGSLKSWNSAQEPLTYHHRTGPIGALFYELRTRQKESVKPGAIGVLGLGTGAVACYGRPGQQFVFYETHPELKKLVAESDEHFTQLRAARDRGVLVEFRFGDRRKNLEADKNRSYAALIVETYDTGFDPGDRLTLEAVQLYMSRLTTDGILALHISNKEYYLEPVVARIVQELNLEARIWENEYEGHPGKTASTWVVIGQNERRLGILARPAVEQLSAFGTKNLPFVELLRKYGPRFSAKEAILKDWQDIDLPLEDYGKRYGQDRSFVLDYVRRADFAGKKITLGDLVDVVHGPLFRPLKQGPTIKLRKDGDRDLPRWPKN